MDLPDFRITGSVSFPLPSPGKLSVAISGRTTLCFLFRPRKESAGQVLNPGLENRKYDSWIQLSLPERQLKISITVQYSSGSRSASMPLLIPAMTAGP